MSIKSKKLDFTGQTFNIGIDAHKSNWKVTIINNGIELKTFSTPPSPDTLAKYLKKTIQMEHIKVYTKLDFVVFGYIEN